MNLENLTVAQQLDELLTLIGWGTCFTGALLLIYLGLRWMEGS